MMRRTWAGALALALVASVAGGCRPGIAASTASTVALTPVTITTAKGQHVFKVEVARTEAEQERGLMFRTVIPPDGGMLFPFATPRVASFWMKNCPVPEDMIFIRGDGTIARIAENTVPYSLDPVSSGEPVMAVLEVAGGRTAELGIREGDRVSWPQ